MQDWSGLSADAFRDEFDGVPENLTKLQDSYDLCAQALQTYWPKLETAQGDADRALERAIAAQADLTAAQSALGDAQDWVSRAGDEADRLEREGEGAEPPDDAEVRAATRDRQAAQQAQESAQGRVDDAQGRLDAARQLAEQAREMREDAAREAARDIDEASDAGIQNRKWWEDAIHWVTENWDTIVDVCKAVVAVLGIVVMIIGGPLAWVVLAAALVVLADTLIKYARGEAGLLDVAFAALDCIPGMKGLTTLGGLARGLKGGLAAARTGMRGLRQGALGLGRTVRTRARSTRSLATRGDPIDMATGEVVISATDVSLAGVLPLVLARHHRSGLRGGTWFGPSWTSTLDQRLVLEPDGLRLHTDDGMILSYPRPVAGEPVLPVEGPRAPLTWDGVPGGTITVALRGAGHTLHFAPVPGRPGADLPLTAMTDRNGNRVSVEYDEAGAPSAVRDDADRHIGVTTDAGRVTELRLLSHPEHPLIRRFAYDGRGNLAAVHDADDRPLTYVYDDRRRVTGWTDREGRWFRYTFDRRGRCVATDGTGGALASRIAYTDDGSTTTYTDALGHSTVYRFNDARQLLSETTALGHTTHRTWDRYDRLLTVTDPLGRTTTYERDDNGDVTAELHPDGGTTRFTRDTHGRWTEAVARDGSRVLREFDERGNLVAVTDPAGATTRHTYDDRGHLLTTTSPLGNTTRVRTDAAGLPAEVTDPLGGTTVTTFDAYGRPVAATGPAGGPVGVERTPDGLPLVRTDGQGGARRFTYDAEGNRLTRTDEAGRTTTFTYGPFGLPATQTRADGSRYTFERDGELRLTRVTNAAGLTWEYVRDADGRLLSETDFDGRTVTYAHDAAGRLVGRTDALGRTTTFRHDERDAVSAVETDGVRTEFTRDAGGRIVRATGADAEVTLIYDAAGRVLSETCDGRTVTHTYDALGRRLSTTTPTGHRITHTYDAAGRRASLTSGGCAITFERDAAGREVRRLLGQDVALARELDATGRTAGLALTTRGRVTLRRGWRRNAAHHPVALGGADGTTGFALDERHRVTDVHADGWSERYAYDADGNLTSAHGTAHPDTDGDRAHSGTRVTRAGRTRYTYDAAGRTVRRQVKRLSGGLDTWEYEWDAADRLTAVTTPDGARWRYRHDPFGRRVAKERLAPDGATVVERTDFTWSGTVLLEQTTTADGGATTVTWACAGRTPVAQTETRSRGAATATADDTDVRFLAIVTDLVGTPTELVDESGAVVWQSRPTLWGTARPAPGATADTPLRFPGQYADPETGWHYNLHRHYDPATGRYTSPDPLGLAPAPSPVAYVAHPHTAADPLGLDPEYFDAFSGDFQSADHFGPLPGRSDGETVFSGHGGIGRHDDLTFEVPEGTDIAVYCDHGEGISTELGNDIELGSATPSDTYRAGQMMPDYVLEPPRGLFVMGDARTVTEPTRLSELLQPNMGRVHWAACRTVADE
nr:DUF6531 domain-containing protein [Streptomyces sp. RFCAC02]